MTNKHLVYLKLGFYTVTILLLFLSQITFFSEVKAALPSISYILLFQITLNYPNLISPIYLLILGIFNDVIYGYYFGVSSFCYILLKYLIIYHRRHYFSFNFLFTWLGFAGSIIIINLFMVIVTHFLAQNKIDFIDLAFSVLVTILLFPITYSTFNNKVIDHEK